MSLHSGKLTSAWAWKVGPGPRNGRTVAYQRCWWETRGGHRSFNGSSLQKTQANSAHGIGALGPCGGGGDEGTEQRVGLVSQ